MIDSKLTVKAKPSQTQIYNLLVERRSYFQRVIVHIFLRTVVVVEGRELMSNKDGSLLILHGWSVIKW